MRLEKYLEEDAKKVHPFEDESIISNLYLSSLPMSMGELDSLESKIEEADNEIRKRKLSKDFEKELEKKDWLLNGCEKICDIKTLSLDRLKECIDRDKKSCDAYFYNPNVENNKKNLLIEFKNVNRDKVLALIKSDDADGLWNKVMDSVSLLKNNVEFEGYTSDELISNTHLMIVYGEKANTVSPMHMNLGSKKPVSKDENGRQNRAVKMDRQKSKSYSKKESDAILNEFSDKIKKKGFASCLKGYFGVPIKEPDVDKSGKNNVCWYTLYSKKDFQRIVCEELFFDEWDWGIYDVYFQDKLG